VGASRSLVTTSEQDARTTQTHQNLCGEVLEYNENFSQSELELLFKFPTN
jgi:hypothetical protein